MKPGTYNDRWTLELPDHIAEWDAITDWERGRFDSMERTLKHGEILFEVGAEHGSHAALFGKFMVGGDALVLMEPSPEFWPNIRRTWEANSLAKPAGCWPGFVSDTSSGDAHYLVDLLSLTDDGWPDEAEGPECAAMPYSRLGDHDRPTIAVDDFVRWSGIVPAALSIDVEGAELLVLNGAATTVLAYRPRVWVSIHADLMEPRGHTPAMIHDYFDAAGYLSRHLGTDHEQHWLFYDPTQRIIL